MIGGEGFVNVDSSLCDRGFKDFDLTEPRADDRAPSLASRQSKLGQYWCNTAG